MSNQVSLLLGLDGRQETMNTAEHVRHVRILYKAILRLHRGLEPELRAFGDQYVKDEFRRHRNAEPPFIPIFMTEWTVSLASTYFTVQKICL